MSAESKIEFECRLNLLSLGVPEVLIQEWYEAVYWKPDVSAAEAELIKYAARMLDSDIMDILVLYGEEGGMAALQESVKYFSKLYGVKSALAIAEDASVGSMTCELRLKNDRMSGLGVLVNPETLAQRSGASLFVMTAHEMFHAKQSEKTDEWIESLCGKKMDFYKKPETARREMLYYANRRREILPAEWKEGYGRQIIEAEACCTFGVMMARLEMFSEKIFKKTMAEFEKYGK